jgi:hypothetical protein
VAGQLRQVPAQGREEAQRLLFSRHPDMAGWPAGHQFRLYELQVSELKLLDWYGGAQMISAEDYFSAALVFESAAQLGGRQ